MSEYAETAYLIAVMENDYYRADTLARDMLPSERARLHAQLLQAAAWLLGIGDAATPSADGGAEA